MTWLFVLTPFLLLPVVLLFRFIGCGELLGVSADEQPSYKDTIKGVAGLIAYWRLIEGENETVAKDEKGLHNGTFKTVPDGIAAVAPQGPPAARPGGEAAPGGFIAENEGLIMSDTAAHPRLFNGGYVEIPDTGGLYTDDFTIETWFLAGWGPNIVDNEHVLFSAGGHYRKFGDIESNYYGFIVSADGTNGWQLSLLPHVGDVFTPSMLVPRSGKTHFALTVGTDATGKQITLFVDGKNVASAHTSFYARPDGAPLTIGVAANLTDSGSPSAPTAPILSTIQEVALYNRALTPTEIKSHFDLNQ